ncbi:testis-specific serine/threonine-protein kinase 5-like [Leucoraja erinacea]|uniref:testis-specific serine/threonine-protein kinase 5-like n=1 Tax=Leucoraja erinaceus TaxID=7782 RepID=UPI002458643F|nr:testis-specific serine/threonine-protein kinase 5-like [Leucoraja erinacea]
MSTFCGSMPYTAPEILQGHRYRGDHADVWSMGIILYAMVAGKLPFNELQPCKLLEAIKGGMFFHDRLSLACQDLINKMLQWKPSSRLVLSDILAHPWMFPATTIRFQKVRLLSARSPPKKPEKEAADKGQSPPTAGGSKGKKVLIVCGSAVAGLKERSQGKGSPQRPAAAARQTQLFTRLPKPPPPPKPARPSARKRPVSACEPGSGGGGGGGLGRKTPGGTQGWSRCLQLSHTAHRLAPMPDYLPPRMKGC